MQKVFTLFISFLLTFSAGLIGSFFTVPAIDTWYNTLAKPFLSPPNWIFAPVWTLLYGLMAVASYRIFQKRKTDSRALHALMLYGIHLLINTSWSLVFFGLQSPSLAFVVILSLLAFIIRLTLLFGKIDRVARLLFVPYLLWVSFATYLNFMTVILN